MSYAWKEIQDWEDHKRKCRISQATHLSSNLYERMREHTVRIVREHEENIALAAADLGCSESTVRKYMKFVPFEHLMRDSTLENRFDWRSMTREKWVKLLCKHPVFISRLPTRNNLYYSTDVCNILLAQPQLSSYFDLQEWNHLELDFSWSKLLRKHPGFAASCDFSVIAALAAKELCKHPVATRFLL